MPVDRALLDTGLVLDVDARLADGVGHRSASSLLSRYPVRSNPCGLHGSLLSPQPRLVKRPGRAHQHGSVSTINPSQAVKHQVRHHRVDSIAQSPRSRSGDPVDTDPGLTLGHRCPAFSLGGCCALRHSSTSDGLVTPCQLVTAPDLTISPGSPGARPPVPFPRRIAAD